VRAMAASLSLSCRIFDTSAGDARGIGVAKQRWIGQTGELI
jgi:hypothetical protein